MTDTTIDSSSAVSGGWSSFFSDLGEVFVDTAREVVPVWTKRELDLQSNPDRQQFNQTLYQPDPYMSNINAGTMRTTADQTQSAQPVKTGSVLGISIGGTHIDGFAVALAVIGVVAAIYVIKKVA